MVVVKIKIPALNAGERRSRYFLKGFIFYAAVKIGNRIGKLKNLVSFI
jgi:hypothetical protein